MFDAVYCQILDRAQQWTTAIVPGDSVAISAVVRTGQGNFIVRLTAHDNLESSIAVLFPLGTYTGEPTSFIQVFAAIRDLGAALLKGEGASHGDLLGAFHGAPLIDGEHLLEFANRSIGAASESVYLTLRGLRAPVNDANENDAKFHKVFPFSVNGFSHHRDGIIRVYLKWHSRANIIGIDLPIATRDAPFARTSGSISELAALLRNGIPANIAEAEVEADDYSSQVYDLQRWFDRSR